MTAVGGLTVAVATLLTALHTAGSFTEPEVEVRFDSLLVRQMP